VVEEQGQQLEKEIESLSSEARALEVEIEELTGNTPIL
jgi:cell division protein FtsB